MATEAQISANRQNAKLSTGPRSQAGRARSSMNALKAGIHAKSETISGEDPEQLRHPRPLLPQPGRHLPQPPCLPRLLTSSPQKSRPSPTI